MSTKQNIELKVEVNKVGMATVHTSDFDAFLVLC